MKFQENRQKQKDTIILNMVTQDQKGKQVSSPSYVDSDLILLNMHMQIGVNMYKAKKERPMRWEKVELKGEGWGTQQKKVGGEYWG